ncbi:gliding motility-associated C-terminal domain-containing protein [Bacteroides stercorirosoris]|uniref:gliding motility-associated C-terminal domain-containing protein n=1 Tax=Bacteroides stercorirosoris TaxID=871324 RepID=UPI00046E6325|nr:gliding motility-associated C-terminal domain-containing protein [Bacteroides stercorirosoris]
MHFKTENFYVYADIRTETVIFAGIMRCGLFLYIGCAAMLLLGNLPVWAGGGRTGLLDMSPVAILLSENGAIPEESVSVYPGDTYTGSAPLEFRFLWKEPAENGDAADENDNLRYEWNFSRDAAFNDIFLTRFDAETIYTFQESGLFYVRLIVTDTETEDTESSDAFVIRIAESELKVPNAFSPNGDGVNDVFRVKHKSLVRFNAYVFNRWGQQLYHWGLQNIDAGWDGTAHGKNVPDGVYFIVVEAEGADGVDYKIKSDINILR